jgi:hypothetical protein
MMIIKELIGKAVEGREVLPKRNEF